MLLYNLGNKLRFAAIGLATLAMTGCDSVIYDDLEECPSGLQLRFEFNYNLLKADAFASQVTSVRVWAFDAAGKFVWSGAEAGEALRQPGYVMKTPLPEGTYDFVAWCGLEDNIDFNPVSYQPTSKADLEMRLRMLQSDGLNISSSHFKSLFNGFVTDVNYVVNPLEPSFMTVTVPLVKDTNDIAIMLCHLDGSPIDSRDFSVSFTYADSYLAWNNFVEPTSPTVTYTPWSTLYGETTNAPLAGGRASDRIRSTLLWELSTSRLMQNGKAYLDIVRNEDNVTIVHVPLIEYFLLEKGSRFDEFSEQEYLDRRDDYTAMFFIDENNNWYVAAGVYINNWAIVPPQKEEF